MSSGDDLVEATYVTLPNFVFLARKRYTLPTRFSYSSIFFSFFIFPYHAKSFISVSGVRADEPVPSRTSRASSFFSW